MKKEVLHCPGKFFILGEYACLAGEKALLQTILPGFTLTIEKEKTAKAFLSFKEFLSQVHVSSPAGNLLLQNSGFFSELFFGWQAPHSVQTGIGSSSAQFVLLFSAVQSALEKTIDVQTFTKKCLAEYHCLSQSSDSILPSGADVVAQSLGGPCVVQSVNDFYYEKLEPLQNSAEFLLVFTGQKKQTHSVLKNLKTQGFPSKFNLGVLREITTTGINAWKSGNITLLGNCLNQYQEALLELSLSDHAFTELVRSMQKIDGVYGCKGAGAQGGDCLLVLADATKRPKTQLALEQKGFWVF